MNERDRLLAEWKQMGAPPLVETALRGEFRRHKRRTIWRGGMWVSAIAASVAIVAMGALTWLSQGTVVQTPALPSVPGPPDVVAVPAPSTAPARNAAVKKRQLRRPAPIAPASKPEPEIVTDFMPVMGGDLTAPLDRGRMVRVRIPRSALGAFGLPFNADRAAQQVKADVVLGEDGLARAIRFVQ